MKTSLDQLDKIVKHKKYKTTVSYCQGCIDYVNMYCTECGRTKLTEDKGLSHFHEVYNLRLKNRQRTLICKVYK